MLCKRCPHLVRHGRQDQSGEIVFTENCGLLMKAEALENGADQQPRHGRRPVKKAERQPPKEQTSNKDHACPHHPFPVVFDYIECNIYRGTFKGGNRKYDVIPTKDFQYSDALTTNSITDMELL